MHARRRFSCPAARAALALGTLSGFAFAPQSAFAQYPITILDSFKNGGGNNPLSGVIFDSNGNLFGTTSSNGMVYEIAKGTTAITPVASFNGTNGNTLIGNVTFDSSGNLFGTTEGGGGSSQSGTVYEIKSADIAAHNSNITNIASFDGTNGYAPFGGVTFDSNGNLYGTTSLGGPNSKGNVYEITKADITGQTSSVTPVASFTGTGTNGFTPEGNVTFDSSGNLFGTTRDGGNGGGVGTVYEIKQGTTTITDLASFDGTNGQFPESGVTFDSAGNLFGTTIEGGASNAGTVYEITKENIANGSGVITNIASFNSANGSSPESSITFDSSGNLFGTTFGGGANNAGTVYEIKNTDIAAQDGFITGIATFDNAGNGGYQPFGGITLDGKGNLYGTTTSGGTGGSGTVYEIANADSSAAPEPSQIASLGLTMFGVAGLMLRARRRAGKNESDAVSA